MAEQTREELLDELVRMTRARDLLAETADRLINERDTWIRLFNRLQGAVQHHQNAYAAAGHLAEMPDEALWHAMNRVLLDAAAFNQEGRHDG